MSNGESPDGFVFPPFIPPSAARPAAPAPQSPPAAAPAEAMAWNSEPGGAVAPAEAATEAEAPDAELEELPWLELPEPRDSGPASQDAAGGDAGDEPGALPDWMTWDARAEAEAEAELAGTPQLEGLEEYDAADLEEIAGEPMADAFPYGEPEHRSEEELRGAAGGEDDAGLSRLELEDAFAPADEAPEETGETAAPAAADAERGFAPDRFEDPFVEAFAATSEAAPFVADDEAVMAAEPGPSSGAGRAPAAGAFDEVAGRLEEIARALRERPDEVLAGRGGDPLALLVAGYAMGWLHGRGR